MILMGGAGEPAEGLVKPKATIGTPRLPPHFLHGRIRLDAFLRSDRRASPQGLDSDTHSVRG